MINSFFLKKKEDILKNVLTVFVHTVKISGVQKNIV